MKAEFTKIKKLLLPQARFTPMVLVLVGVALLFVGNTAWAGLEQILASYLILPVAQFFGSLTVTLIGILISVAQYNDFIDTPAVQKGWVLLRDVTNMFFVVILLLIAFGTLFRWDNYHYKKLLGKLLIMAVLVNFSKGITGFMIDFAQVLMLTFVNGFKDAAAGNFVQGFHLDKMFQFASNRLTPEEARNLQADETSFLVASILALISIFVAMVVIGVIVVVLIFRIVALWFLVITSPIAYTLNIFPGQGQKYAQMWWDYFGRYAATGPVLAFFLWLSLSVMQITSGQSANFLEQKDSAGSGLTDVPAAAITGIGSSDILLSFIVNISLLVGALWMTKQMGVAGGNMASSAMGYLQKGGASIAKFPFKTAAGLASVPAGMFKRYYKEKAPGWAQPVALWKGRQARIKGLEEEAESVSAARGRDTWTHFMTHGKNMIPDESLAHRAIESKYEKDLAPLQKEQKAFAMQKAWDLGGPEGERIRTAIMMAAAAESHMDDLVASQHFAFDRKWKDQNGKTHTGFARKVDGDGKYVLDVNGDYVRGELSDEEVKNRWSVDVNSQAVVHDFMRAGLGESPEGMRRAYDIGELMSHVGHHQGREHAHVDAKTGEWQWFDAEHAAEHAQMEISKLGKREIKQAQAHTFYTIRQRGNRKSGLRTYFAQPEGSFEDQNFQETFMDRDATDTGRYTKQRTAAAKFGNMFIRQKKYLENGKENPDADLDGFLEIDDQIIKQNNLKRDYERNSAAMRALYDRSSAKGIYYNKERYNNLDDLAKKRGWVSDDNYGEKKPDSDNTGKDKKKSEDIDVAKQSETRRAVQAFASQPNNQGEDFFDSQEYQFNKDKYMNRDDYYSNESVVKSRGDSGGISVNDFARGKQNAIAVDFKKLQMPELSGLAGVFLSSSADIMKAADKLSAVIKDQIHVLKNKDNKGKGDEIIIGNLERALKRLSDPSALPNLTLYNSGREGIGARQLITHEQKHAALNSLDPTGATMKNLWMKFLSSQDRKQAQEKIQKRVGHTVSEGEAIREYFAEGLANETQWGDKSPSAIKLNANIKLEFEKIAQSKIGDLSNPKISVDATSPSTTVK